MRLNQWLLLLTMLFNVAGCITPPRQAPLRYETQQLESTALEAYQAGQLDTAYRYLKRSQALSDMTGDEASQKQTLRRIGNLSLQQQRWSDAEHAFNSLKALAANDTTTLAYAYFGLAQVYWQQQQWQSSQQALQQSQQLTPETELTLRQDQQLLNALLLQYSATLQASQDALLSLLKQVDSMSLQQAAIWYNLAVISVRQQHWLQAEQHIVQALALDETRYDLAAIALDLQLLIQIKQHTQPEHTTALQQRLMLIQQRMGE